MRLRFSRRNFLSSSTLAAVSSMPFVRSLVPDAHAAGNARFLFAMYNPFGVYGPEWYPTTFGRDFQFKKASAPLAKIKDNLILFSNIDNAMGEKNECKNGVDQHQAGVSSLFAGATMTRGGFGSGPGAPTIDSVIAKHLHPERHHDQVVTNLGVRSTEHGDHWIRYLFRKSDGAIVNSEDDPAKAFKALFGTGVPATGPAAKPFTGLKDALREDLNLFERRLAQPEKIRFQKYMDSFATFEKEMASTLTPVASTCDVKPAETMVGQFTNTFRSANIWPIAQLQIKLGILAMSCGARQVATLHLTDGFRGYLVPPGPHPDSASPDGHGLSHHTSGGNHENQRTNLNFRQAQLFVEVVESLKAASNPLSGGNLFDESVVLWSSCISGNGGGGHSKLRIPFTMAAGSKTGFVTGRHLDGGFGTNNMILRGVTTAFGMPDKPFGDVEFCSKPMEGLFENSASAGKYDRNVLQYKNLTGRCSGHTQ